MASTGGSPPMRDADSRTSVDITVYVVGDVMSRSEPIAGVPSSASVSRAGRQSGGTGVKLSVSRKSRSSEIVHQVLKKLRLEVDEADYELIELTTDSDGRVRSECRLSPDDSPVSVQRMWVRRTNGSSGSDNMGSGYGFELRRRASGGAAGKSVAPRSRNSPCDDVGGTFQVHLGPGQHTHHHRNKDYPDLCDLPELNESTLLANLRSRFLAGNIYTYVGAILVAVNPFRYYPIYNPKYVKLYQGRGRRSDLPPHIFAIADAAYTTLNRRQADQCIVISGESGSGKTESSNFLLHHLSVISRKMFHADADIEQCILKAGPVLEAFGNAKTVHNNNSSRFGKFVQINYRQNGSVHGACIEKYLLEKSRIVKQAANERNYHVFYYLFAGLNDAEKEELSLTKPEDYFYLNQNNCYQLDGTNNDPESQSFNQLRHCMEAVGLLPDTQTRIFIVLSAILHLGNVEFVKNTEHGHHDDAVTVQNMSELSIVSRLLKLSESTLVRALTTRKTLAGGETVVMSYRHAEAIAARDAMSKCLYGALFDWIVLQINTTMLSKNTNRQHQGNSIGVLDIFGFEDFKHNGFEQFCINFANEALHYYFNQHIFKFEQEEYRREGIRWTNIDFVDNTGCLELFMKKPTGLLCLLDEESNFHGATNETLLTKFNSQHHNTAYYEAPATRQSTFSILHYAGKVKYYIHNFREKNSDLMQRDVVVLLKNSNFAFLRELIGDDPLAVLRWALVRVFFRAFSAFIEAGRRHRRVLTGSNLDRYGGVARIQVQRRGPLLSDPSMSEFARDAQSPESCEQNTVKNSLDIPGSKLANRKVSRRVSSPIPADSVKSQNFVTKDDTCMRNLAAGYSNKSSVQHRFFSKGLDANGSSESPQKKDMTSSPKHGQRNKVYKPRRTARLKTMQSFHAAANAGSKMAIGSRKSKSKPPSISAQFNSSLTRLMDALNQANPFFIRCIKSNADKAPGEFDCETVERQLRYTGMLATVQIRQAGYNYRLPFQDFIYDYGLLLPKRRLSSRKDIQEYLVKLEANDDSYQIGETKVFLRESVKQLLEEQLHQALVQRAVVIQSWTKAKLQRRRFLMLRQTVINVQCYMRGALARQRLLNLQCQYSASIIIQRAFRAHRHRVRHFATVIIQSYLRGYLTRERCKALKKPDTRRTVITVQVGSPSPVETWSITPTGETLTSAKTGLATLDGEISLTVRTSSSATAANVLSSSKSLSASSLDGMPSPSEPVSVTSAAYVPPTSKSVSVTSAVDVLPASTSVSVTSAVETPSYCTSAGDILPPSKSVIVTSAGEVPALAGAVSVTSTVDLHSTAKSIFITSTLNISSPTKTVSVTEENGSNVDSCTVVERSNEPTPAIEFRLNLPEVTTRTEVRVEKPLGNERSEAIASKQPTTNNKPCEIPVSSTYRVIPADQPLQIEIASLDASPESTLKPITAGKSPVLSVTFSTSPLTEEEKDVNSGKDSLTSIVPASDSTIATGVVSHELAKSLNVSASRLDQQSNLSIGMAGAGGLAPTRLQPGSSPISSPSNRRKVEKSASTINIRTQSGPRDVQLEIKPVVVKAISDERLNLSNLSDYQRSTEAFQQKSMQAPLARTESFDDNVARIVDSGVRTVILTFDTEDRSTLPRTDRPPNEVAQTTRSPFSRVKNNVKQMLTAKDGSTGCFTVGDLQEAVEPPLTLRQKIVTSKVVRYNKMPGSGVESVSISTPTSSNTNSSSNTSTWSLSSASEWKYPTDTIIHTSAQLKQLQQFLSSKINEYSRNHSRGSDSEEVFHVTLKTFYENLVATGSKEGMQYRYCDLMSQFKDTLLARARAAKLDSSFPATVFINGFRGYLDEFVKKLESKELPEVKTKKGSVKHKKKKEPKETIVEQCGHRFATTQFSIYTVCEHCTSRMWPLEKGLVCKDCPLTIHRKCVNKLTYPCRHNSNRPSIGSISQHSYEVKEAAPKSGQGIDGSRIVLIVERLIGEIEKLGLFTVGIYRKPGPAAKVKKLLSSLNTTADLSMVNLVDASEQNVHVLTSVLKAVFRDMPEPLLTFDLYSDFIASTETTDEKERIQSIYSLIGRLPPINHELLEKLVFHLSRVAQQEPSNCMSPQGLAISFAPSILRTTLTLSPVESYRHVTKQAECLQCIIDAQVKKLQSGLADIMTLDERAIAVNERLTVLRTSQRHPTKDMVFAVAQRSSQREMSSDESAVHEQAEINQLSEQILSIQEERDALTSQLPNLDYRGSNSEDDLLSADERDSVIDDEPTDSDSVIDMTPDSQNTSDSSHAKMARHLTRHRHHPPLQLRHTPPSLIVRHHSLMDQSVDDLDSPSINDDQ